MRVIGVIPSRYASTRFPGKPLANISGYPMIWWVYNRAKLANCIDELYVATDDKRIRDVCDRCSIPVIMTSDKHPTAAHRLQEVSEIVKADFYLQINGDEPLINIDAINASVPEFIPQDIEFGTNIVTEIDDPAQAIDPSNIKVVFDDNMNALYMSRTPIPYPFKAIDFKYYKHVGIIGYNKKMLDFHINSKPGRFERIEGIDTLRFIDYGKKLKLIILHNRHNLSDDTEKDLLEVIKMIKESGMTIK